jgi:hypothetical protein
VFWRAAPFRIPASCACLLTIAPTTVCHSRKAAAATYARRRLPAKERRGQDFERKVRLERRIVDLTHAVLTVVLQLSIGVRWAHKS